MLPIFLFFVRCLHFVAFYIPFVGLHFHALGVNSANARVFPVSNLLSSWGLVQLLLDLLVIRTLVARRFSLYWYIY